MMKISSGMTMRETDELRSWFTYGTKSAFATDWYNHLKEACHTYCTRTCIFDVLLILAFDEEY